MKGKMEMNEQQKAKLDEIIFASKELLKNFHNMLGDIVSTSCDDCGLDIEEDIVRLKKAVEEITGEKI